MFRPHFNHAAEIVLRDFRAGLLGHFNLDIDFLTDDAAQSFDMGTEAS